MKPAEKYSQAFSKLEEVIDRRVKEQRYPAMGYTSNLDLLCDFNVDVLNDLLQTHLPGERLSQMVAPKLIRSIEDLLHGMVYFCINGVGGEVDVENMDVVKNNFSVTNAMGGTAVQAAMALSAVGCPSIVHLTDDSREVCEQLDTPYIFTVSEKENLIHTGEIVQENEQEIHCIVQFKKGDVLCLGEEKISIPVSNRLILTKITVNEFVPFSKPYFSYLEQHASSISSNVLSSFNALLNQEVLLERLNFVKAHVQAYQRANPQGMVFFEDAHYHNEQIKRSCLDTIYPYADLVSLNEEELQYTLGMYGFSVDIQNILSCVEGAKFMRNWFRVKRGVIVHTKDYSMYVGDRLDGVDIESGLIYGNLLATAKAQNGWYGRKEQLQEIMDFNLSPKGMENWNTIAASNYADEVVLVPSKYIDKPKYTIGLGDSFVAGVQICF